MNSPQSLVPGTRRILSLLAAYRWRWLTPAVVVALLAAAYALLVPPTWQATQALLVRNEAANGDTGLGKFSRVEDLKNVQGTILELAKGRGVLRAALEQVGPPAGCTAPEAWPTERDVDALRRAVKVVPPKGVEFGTAEVFYIETRDHDRARAVLLNEAICGQLQLRLQELRDAKAQSMIDELGKTALVARTDLAEASARLADMEKQVGADLPELRALQETNAGEVTIRRTVSEIENELRQARANAEAHGQLLDLLRASKDDPGRLLAASGRLLESQPALRKLKEGLVEAQLRSAALEGKMTAEHPTVRAAKEAEEEVGRHLHDELAIAVRGVESDLKISAARTAMLETQLARTNQRLAKLAELRTPYVHQVAEFAQRSKLVERAEQNLAEARAARASAKAASLISRIDSPDTGVRPVSASRALIVLAGLVGGLLAGLGVLLLTTRAEASAVDAPVQPLDEQCDLALPVFPASRLPSSVGRDFDHKDGLTLRQALERIAKSSGA